jgi:DNA (cytosine-5)-methyltransferase 1
MNENFEDHPLPRIRFGSVCSGIEAASVAWHPLGWRAAWLAEIEPFPSAVLAHHYPDVPNIGDMTKLLDLIPSGQVDAPDVFCGGTPCQAFSVAGLRKSLDDARGNLSLTFCEIANAIDNVRHASGKQPAVIFWENVPGVLNTKDNAFGCFLAGLAGEDDPLVAPGGKWANAGCVYGPSRSVAWRVLDAQYFGVAQRRRRVFVVASARDDFDPAAVLFEFDGVRRDSAPSREAGKVAPTIPARSLGGGGLGTDFDRDGGVVQVCPTLRAGGNQTGGDRPPGTDVDTADSLIPVAFVQNSRDEVRLMGGDGAVVGALAAETGAKQQCYIAFHGSQDPDVSGDVTHPVGRNQGRETCVAFSAKDYGADATDELAPTLRDMNHADSHANGGGQMAVAVALRGREGGATAELGDEVQNCLRASQGGGDKPHVLAPVAIGWDEELNASAEQSGTLLRGGQGGRHDGVMTPAMQVRRLTPVECERLQGFPDGYTQIPWRKKPAEDCPDGPRYKALGNSWAVPNVRWIGQRIDAAVRRLENANDNVPVSADLRATGT